MNNTIFTSHYLTDWILIATTLVSFVISWKFRAHKQLFLIRIYIAASLFVDILSSATELFFPESKICLAIDNAVLNLYSILEISVIYLFINRTISRKSFKISIQLFYIFYVGLCLIIWVFFPKAIISNTPYLFALEGILIAGLCLPYFYELIYSLPIERISKVPDFWVISGILFYYSSTFPFYFILIGLHYAPSINVIFISVNYFLYTILFLAFIKAFLCPIHIRK